MSVKSFVDAVAGKGPGAAALIVRQALASRDIFFFGSLFETAEVQALQGTPDEPMLRLLEVFCFGTIADVPSLPTAAQAFLQGSILMKLRQLSFLSQAASKRRLTYSEIAAATGLSELDTRELEDMVIDTVTDGLLAGKIDPLQRRVDVSDVTAREVHPNDAATLDDMIGKLTAFKSKCEVQLRKLAAVKQANADDALGRQGWKAARDAEEASRMDSTLAAIASDHAALRDGPSLTRPNSGRQYLGSRGAR
jgi:hypothetical protein